MRSIMSVGTVLCGLFLIVYLYALPIAYAIPDDGIRGNNHISYVNTGDNPGNPNAPGYNYSQSSYGRADRDQQGGYSQSSYVDPKNPDKSVVPTKDTPTNQNQTDNDDDDNDNNNSSSNYLPPVVRSVASLIWSAGAKTVETATRVFAAAQAVVTRSTARDTYTSLPSYPNTDANPDTAGRSPAVPTPPTTFFDTPVSNLPISPALRAQIDAIEKQQTKTGVLTEVLTPTQEAILERARIELGANITNPAVESAILLATRGQSVTDAIALLQEVERVTGGTINGAAVDVAFGRSCGDADCDAADLLRTLAGIGGSVQAKEELERQMQGVDERRKQIFQAEMNASTAEREEISYKNGNVSYYTGDTTVTYKTRGLNVIPQTEEERRQEEIRQRAITESYTEYARTRSLSDSVPMGDAYYALRDAETSLAEARILALGAPSDSLQGVAYAYAKTQYDSAVTSYKNALAQIDNYQELNAQSLALQATNDALKSSVVSERITSPDEGETPLDRITGSALNPIKANIIWDLGPGRPNQPTSDVATNLQDAVSSLFAATYEIVIISGQENEGEVHGAAVRHPEGYAVDFELQENGQVVPYTGNEEIYHDIAIKMAADYQAYVGVGHEYMGGVRMHVDITPQSELVAGQGPQWMSGAQSIAGELNEARRTGIYTGSTPERPYSSDGTLFDFDAYAEEKVNPPQIETVSTSNTPETLTERATNAVRSTVQIALAVATNPVGTALSFLNNILTNGSFSISKNFTPKNDNDSSSKPRTTVVVAPVPATDLYSTATGATVTGKQTATSTEYKFGGSLTRILSEAEAGLKTTDINANYADTVTTSLSIDYQCDNTVNATATVRTLYTAFDVTEDTSKVLMSVYVPLTEFGTHCFYFTTDTKNVVTEKDESNNKSNVYRFIVGEGLEV